MALNIINCIAIDDDSSALRLIREYCAKIQFVNLAGTFSNPFEALQTINNNQVDLIFLDIVMPQITGPEFLKTLYNPPMVIFTTAFREYAAEGFESDAVDFLAKLAGIWENIESVLEIAKVMADDKTDTVLDKIIEIGDWLFDRDN